MTSFLGQQRVDAANRTHLEALERPHRSAKGHDSIGLHHLHGRVVGRGFKPIVQLQFSAHVLIRDLHGESPWECYCWTVEKAFLLGKFLCTKSISPACRL